MHSRHLYAMSKQRVQRNRLTGAQPSDQAHEFLFCDWACRLKWAFGIIVSTRLVPIVADRGSDRLSAFLPWRYSSWLANFKDITLCRRKRRFNCYGPAASECTRVIQRWNIYTTELPVFSGRSEELGGPFAKMASDQLHVWAVGIIAPIGLSSSWSPESELK